MPFQRNRDLPSSVRENIPSKSGKDLFRRVVNAQFADGESESAAFASAWTALRQAGFRQNDNGKWVKKMADDHGPLRAAMESVVKAMGYGRAADALAEPSSEEPAGTTDAMDLAGRIVKADDEQRIVYGWASVATHDGEPVVDSDGDIVPADEIEKAATAFMQDARMAKAMHDGEGIGEVIHSLPVTKAIADALGIESSREGWVIAMKIHDDATWQRVKDGELSAFSIGGTAKRERAAA